MSTLRWLSGINLYCCSTFFVFKNPKVNSTIRYEMFNSFSGTIFLIAGGYMVLICFALKIIWHFERRTQNIRTTCSTMTAFLIALGAFCQQGKINTVKEYLCIRINVKIMFCTIQYTAYYSIYFWTRLFYQVKFDY